MRLPLTLLALAALSQPASAGEGTPTTQPEQIGEIFCMGSVGNDMAPVEGLLSADLADLIARAETRNADIQALAPDEKPPLGDGLPWRSFPDYADNCAIGDVGIAEGTAQVAIHYGFSEYPEADYVDMLIMVEEQITTGGSLFAWRIDDIEFTDHSTMRSALESVLAN